MKHAIEAKSAVYTELLYTYPIVIEEKSCYGDQNQVLSQAESVFFLLKS